MWDLPPKVGEGGRDEEVWLAYGDYDLSTTDKEEKRKKDKKELEKKKKEKKEKRDGARDKDWEEGVRYGSAGRTGEWRRRRWVRVVRRREIREYV